MRLRQNQLDKLWEFFVLKCFDELQLNTKLKMLKQIDLMRPCTLETNHAT